MDDDKIFEHQIKIDDNTDVRLKIPEIIDAVEFTSILEKARKILKISEIQISAPYKRAYNKVDTQEKLLQEYENADSDQRKHLVKKYGIKNYQALQSKIYFIRKKLGQPVYKSKNSVGRKKKYSDELVSDIVKRIQAGESIPHIANNLQISKKVLYRIITKRTGKSLRELRIERLNSPRKYTRKNSCIWTEKKVKIVIALFKQGQKARAIGERLGLTRKQVQDKLYGLRQAKMLRG